MLLPEITERLLCALKRHPSALPIETEEGLGPRPLSVIERDWLKLMLNSSVGWEDADISQTSVARTEPGIEGILIVLDAPAAENPHAVTVMNSYAQIWIETADRLVVNVLLHEWRGQLQNLYVGVVDPEHPRSKVNTKPETWIEKSRHVVGFGS